MVRKLSKRITLSGILEPWKLQSDIGLKLWSINQAYSCFWPTEMLHLPGFAQVITSAWDSLPVHSSTSIFPTCSHPPGKHSEPIWNHGGPFLCSGHHLSGLITCISVKNGLISVFTSMHHLFLLPDRWITQGVFKKTPCLGPCSSPWNEHLRGRAGHSYVF